MARTERETQILQLARDGKCRIKNDRHWKAWVSDGLHGEGLLKRVSTAGGFFRYELTADGESALDGGDGS